MTILSTRHLGILTLAVAAAAVVVGANRGRSWDDCRDPTALRDAQAIPGSSDVVEDRTQYRGSIFQDTEGDIAGTGLRFAVFRSWFPEDLIRSPLRSVHPPMIAEATATSWVDAAGTRLPVHRTTNHQAGSRYFATWFFVYDGQPVQRVLPRQIATLGPQVLHGSRPVTLFLVWGRLDDGDGASDLETAVGWLAAAWSHYARVCAP